MLRHPGVFDNKGLLQVAGPELLFFFVPMKRYPFVVRVYGVYLHPVNGVLVSDEFIFGRSITKFPGGGLEFGEGTIECLEREMLEETGHRFSVVSHLYTTDFFVPSAFDPEVQVMSIYYRMEPAEELRLNVKQRPFEFDEVKDAAQVFRWIPAESISAADFQLVIDQHVAELIRESAPAWRG